MAFDFVLLRLHIRRPGQGFYLLIGGVEHFDPDFRWVLFSIDRRSLRTRFTFFNR